MTPGPRPSPCPNPPGPPRPRDAESAAERRAAVNAAREAEAKARHAAHIRALVDQAPPIPAKSRRFLRGWATATRRQMAATDSQARSKVDAR
jgi:hypothetical protein